MSFGTITSTESTFGSISGSIVGAVPGTLSGSVGVPGPIGPQGVQGIQGPPGPPGEGGTWGSIVGTLSNQTDLQTALNAKLEVTDAASTYYLQTNPAGYITSSALTGYATESWVTSQGYETAANAAATYYPLTNPAGYLTSSALTGYATESWVTAGFYPLTGNPSGFITSAALSGYAPLASPALTGNVTITTNSTSPALVITQDGTGDVVQFKDATSDTTYSFIDLNGKVNTVASTTTSAGFNVPHGTAPTSPVNGDVWTTTGNLWVRINGVSQAIALQGNSAQLSSNNIFTNASSTYGNSTAAGTINLGTGATISGSTKTINVGTGGAAGSTTTITLGSSVAGAIGTTTVNNLLSTVASTTTTAGLRVPHGTAPTTPVNGDIWTTTAAIFVRINGSSNWLVDGTTTQDIGASKTFSNANVSFGTSAGTGTVNVGTGATISGSTKAVNIGTSGVAGSTTNIAIGSTTGTSTTTLQGITNGVTQSAGDSSLKLATTAFVTTADNLKANLASPALTGTPTAPTATAGTNTTQIATTAFVQQEVPAASTTAAGKVELATRVEVIEPTSNTLAVTPFQAIDVLMHPGYMQIAQNNNNVTTATSGAGAGIFTTSMTRVCLGPNASTAGYVTYRPQTNGGVAQMWSRGNSGAQINFSKKVWISGRSAYDNSFIGDANNISRVTIGKAAVTAGALAQKGIGWEKAGGSTANFFLLAHNGTTLTSVNTNTSLSSLGLSGGSTFDWSIYSDGAGNVTMWINDTQVATTSAGPTGLSLASCVWQEEIDQSASAATRMYFSVYGGHFYHV